MSKVLEKEIPNFEEFAKYCELIENSVFFHKTREMDKSSSKGNCFDGEVDQYQLLKNLYNAIFFIKGLDADTFGNDKKSKRFKNLSMLLNIFFGWDSTEHEDEIHKIFFQNKEEQGNKIFDQIKDTCVGNTFCFLVNKSKTTGGTMLTPTENIRSNNSFIKYDQDKVNSIYWNNNNDYNNPGAFNGLYGLTSGLKFLKLPVEFSDINKGKKISLTHFAKYNPILSYKNIKSLRLTNVTFPFDNISLMDNFFPNPLISDKWENIFYDYCSTVRMINRSEKATYYYNSGENSIAILTNANMRSIQLYNTDVELDYDNMLTDNIKGVNDGEIRALTDPIGIHNVSLKALPDNMIDKFSSMIYIKNKQVPKNRKDLIFSYITNFINPHIWDKINLSNKDQFKKMEDFKFDFELFKSESTRLANWKVEQNFQVNKQSPKLSDLITSYSYDKGDINFYEIEDKKTSNDRAALRYGIITTSPEVSIAKTYNDKIEYKYYNRNMLACMLMLVRALYKNDYNWSQYVKEEYNISTDDQASESYGTTTYSLNVVGIEKPYEKVLSDSMTQQLMNPLYSVYKNSDEKNRNEELIEKIKSALYGYEIDFDKRSEFIIPISVSVEIDGISGLRVNDAIDLDFLPDVYKNNITLSIIGISHSITNEWVTNLDLIIKTRIK